MKRLFSILCAATLTLSTMNAALLFNEHFDRVLGTLSASTWYSGGTLPNDSNWHTYSPGDIQFQVVSQQLQFTDYCSASSGKAVEYTTNHSRDYILFRQAFNGQAGDNVYMAFLLKVNELQTTSGAMSTTNANNSILTFAINASNNALGSLNGRVLIQTVDENTYHLGVTRRGETPQFATANLQTGVTYLVVAEYAFIAGEKNDIVSLYINPTKTEQTVAVSSVNPSSASADTETLVGVALCSNGNTPYGMYIDEIRVATSWDEIWEDEEALTPTISAADNLAFNNVFIGEATERTVTISGANLNGPISVVSDNAALVPAVSSISKAEAEAGYTLHLSLTATQSGAGSANIILTSSGASDHVIAASWTAAQPIPPVGTELLENRSFEEYTYNAMFACHSFDNWQVPLTTATIEQEDKLDGAVSIKINTSSNNPVLEQEVPLSDADYAAGTLFQLTIHYKVLYMPADKALALDCYWEAAAGGDAEAIKAHDADILQRVLADDITSDWQDLIVTTSKPSRSSKFRVRLSVPKYAQVLFDDFSLVRTENAEPYILVTPDRLPSVNTTIGNSVTMQTLHIEQGNLNGPTSFELSYTDAGQFQLSTDGLAADQSTCDLIITYAPTRAGTHIAYLNIDNLSHPALHQTIRLEGTCTDPEAQPSVTVTPSTLSDFEVLMGNQQQASIMVRSENCNDYLYLRVEHIIGEAFVIYGSMLPKNTESEVIITFNPLEAGDYQSQLVIYSQSNEFEPITIVLNGTANPVTPETIDWATDFVWDDSAPLAHMVEDFETVEHNQTIHLDGWQNVAPYDQRPWKGFDETQTQVFEGDGKFAQASTYQSRVESTETWEMWLVTPALDYLNAESKVFAFSVMGQYLPEDNIQSTLEIYYLDPYSADTLFKQDLTSSFSIPTTEDEKEQWITFELDLAPYAETVADVFHMAFRLVGPNGAEGVVTYYIDNVSWGSIPEGIEEIIDSQKSKDNSRKILHNGQLYLMYEGKMYDVQGKRVKW